MILAQKVQRATRSRGAVNAVAGAELAVIQGMGQGLTEGLWPQVVDAIARHAGRGSRQHS